MAEASGISLSLSLSLSLCSIKGISIELRCSLQQNAMKIRELNIAIHFHWKKRLNIHLNIWELSFLVEMKLVCELELNVKL